jgi:pimeloyl-ACP methyl ester carboxylesterase
MARAQPGPHLPHGAAMHLPGRGTTFVRTMAGPPNAPTVLLLHGWTASADLNWFTCYRPLSRHYRVVALDHRGHGRGIRSKKAFRLEDCADDALAVCDVLGIEQVIPVGYSMGGPIAQLMWRRHPDRIRGLALCATAPYFLTSREEKLGFIGLSGLARGGSPHAGASSPVAHRAVLPAAQEQPVGAVGHSGGVVARLADGARGGPGNRPVQLARVDRRGRRAPRPC